jgi:beta-mannosidase
MASVREYLEPDEMSLASVGWRIHSNEGDLGATAAGVAYHYGDPSRIPLTQFILYGQMYQAVMNSNFMEGLRFRKDDLLNDCQGHLVWSFNETWGEMGWSIIDHYLRRKASYYWLRRSALAVKVLVRSHNGQLATRVINDTTRRHQAIVQCGWMRVDGSAIEFATHAVELPANSNTTIAGVPLPSASTRNPHEWIYAATIGGGGDFPANQAVWLLAPYRELELKTPIISSTVRNGKLRVESPTYCHAAHLEDDGSDVLADNYFDILPGWPQEIPITNPNASGLYSLRAVMPIKGG